MNRRLHIAATTATAALAVAAALCCTLTVAPDADAPIAASRDGAGGPSRQQRAPGTAPRAASRATAFSPAAG